MVRLRRSYGTPALSLCKKTTYLYPDLQYGKLGLEQEPIRKGDGKISIRPNPYARKDCGSFFTPQELVDLIVEQTLKPLAEERLKAFEDKAERLSDDRRPQQQRKAELLKLDPAEAVLNLKVLDPAMGRTRKIDCPFFWSLFFVDLALLVDVYHELSHPWEMIRGIHRALKPGGRLVLVEYRAEDPTVPILRLHKMSLDQVRREISAHPLVWVETLDLLPRQHIVIFQKPTG